MREYRMQGSELMMALDGRSSVSKDINQLNYTLTGKMVPYLCYTKEWRLLLQGA